MEIVISNSNEVIVSFIKEKDILKLLKYLLQMPVSTEFEVKPNLITYMFYKKNQNHFEIHTTAGDWLMTTTNIKLATYFLFGKVSSTFFNWI